ncbi:unnamed protein product, partial [Hapterophycus canaliculatus]
DGEEARDSDSGRTERQRGGVRDEGVEEEEGGDGEQGVEEHGEQEEEEVEEEDEMGEEQFEGSGGEQDEEEEDEEDEEEDGDDFADMSREELSELWGILKEIGWFSLLQDGFSAVMSSNVLAYVRRSGGGGSGVSAAYGWEQRLGLAVHEAFCSARIAELFDIIADYPDSAVAIGELKTALRVTQQHQRLAVLLRESVKKRLLHPGANTHQIIDVYIATIKVLRILDPKV